MYEIKSKNRHLPDGTKITTYTREIYSANVLEVEAGTTGYKGGDTGHGCRTYFRIQDVGCTDLTVRTIKDQYDSCGVEVFLGGDCELDTIIMALKFITKVLEDEANEVHD